MKKITLFLAICLMLSCFSGCAKSNSFSENFFFMDTVIGITLYTDEAALAENAFDECRAILSELDTLWARQKPDSDIARWNASSDGNVSLDFRTRELIRTALEVSRDTGAAFDVTVAPLVDLWQTCGERDQLPTEAELSEVLAQIGYDKIAWSGECVSKTDPQVAIDLGGIGKGAATDALLAYLTSLRLDGGLVTFGSNVAVFGKKPDESPYRIALRHPRENGASLGTLLLPAGQVLSVSGDYERYVTIDGENYHHILDLDSGYPADTGLASVAVVAADGVLADALSTALLVMGKDRALDFYRTGIYDFEVILTETDGTLTVTDGISDLFITN